MASVPVPTEHELQAAIVDALRLCGLTVYETTAYRQKGASGCDKGVPDLLVSVPGRKALAVMLEVKRPGPVRWSSREQHEAFLRKHTTIAQSVAEACREVAYAIDAAYVGCPEHPVLAKLMAMSRQLGGSQ